MDNTTTLPERILTIRQPSSRCFLAATDERQTL